MKCRDTPCPACHAAAGEDCHDIGYGDERRSKGGYHMSRKRRAHYETIAQRSNAARKVQP